jgi:hypothetical protein
MQKTPLLFYEELVVACAYMQNANLLDTYNMYIEYIY